MKATQRSSARWFSSTVPGPIVAAALLGAVALSLIGWWLYGHYGPTQTRHLRQIETWLADRAVQIRQIESETSVRVSRFTGHDGSILVMGTGPKILNESQARAVGGNLLKLNPPRPVWVVYYSDDGWQHQVEFDLPRQ